MSVTEARPPTAQEHLDYERNMFVGDDERYTVEPLAHSVIDGAGEWVATLLYRLTGPRVVEVRVSTLTSTHAGGHSSIVTSASVREGAER